MSRKESIKWTTSEGKTMWKAFDEDLENILESTLAGNLYRKIRPMTPTTYSVGKDIIALNTSGKEREHKVIVTVDRGKSRN